MALKDAEDPLQKTNLGWVKDGEHQNSVQAMISNTSPLTS